MAIKSISDIPAKIREKWSCVTYARDILGLPVFRSGDRCTSITPGPHSHNDGLIVNDDSWHDFSAGLHGDVIDLCAYARHNGNLGEAMRELGAEFFTNFKPAGYERHQKTLAGQIKKWHEALRPEDREYLHDRRITDQTIDRLMMGYCAGERHSPWNWYNDRIIIPYWKNGHVVFFAGRDCSGLWKTDSKNHPKYKKMWTKGNEYSENTMWGWHTLAKDWCADSEKDKYLCILEGQFDAMSFEQDGWHVLSPIGGRFAHKLMLQVKSICRNYEKVFICMDNDGPGVAFQLDIAKFCFRNRIPFVCGHVPGHYDGLKIKDVSDYYAAGGSLDELVSKATEGLYDLARSFKPGEEKDFHDFIVTAGRYADRAELMLVARASCFDKDWVSECVKEAKRPPLESEIAEEIVKEHELLYMVNDGYYEYSHGVWSEKPMLSVQAIAREKLGRFATAGSTAGVAKHVQIIRHRKDGFNNGNIINFLDGVLDLETMKLNEHSPAYLSTIQIPRVYDPKAECPKTRRFITQIMEGDKEKELLLQQMAGYFFMVDNKLNKGFFLMGDGANGKSVLIELLRYVIDPRNCSNVELSDMADRFEPLRLRNSLVNFATETRVDLKGAEAAIKKVISGETMSAAHKGVDAVEFTPHCKIVCACNNFIHSKDITHGFVRRCKFVMFNKIFTDKTANTGLLDELKEEAAGVLNWMIEGWHMLKESGKFIETHEEVQTREEFLILANPLAGFIREKLTGLYGKWSSTDIYDTFYTEWSRDAHVGQVSRPQMTKSLTTLIRQMMPEVKIARHGIGQMYTFPEKGNESGDKRPDFDREN